MELYQELSVLENHAIDGNIIHRSFNDMSVSVCTWSYCIKSNSM